MNDRPVEKPGYARGVGTNATPNHGCRVKLDAFANGGPGSLDLRRRQRHHKPATSDVRHLLGSRNLRFSNHPDVVIQVPFFSRADEQAFAAEL